MTEVPKGMQREYYTALTTRRGSWLYGAGLAVASAVIVWAVGGGGLFLLLPVALLLLAPGTGRLLSPAESLWLEGAVLVQELRGMTTRLDLTRLCRAEREWVPNKGDDLVLIDEAGRQITVSVLTETTESLRRAIGQRVRVVRASTNLYDPETRRLLLLDE